MGQDAQCRSGPYSKTSSGFKRGGFIPHWCATLLKYFFWKSSNQLHIKCLKLFETVLNFSGNSLRMELRVQRNAPNIQQYDNQNRHWAFVVILQSNNKLYIVIPFHVFRNYIRGWQRSAHRCYILRSRTINDAFNVFDTTNIQKIVHKSDGTDELDDCKTSTRVKRIYNSVEQLPGFSYNSENWVDEFRSRLTEIPFVQK